MDGSVLSFTFILHSGSTVEVSLNETFGCPTTADNFTNPASRDNPVPGVLSCTVVNPSFAKLIEHGDKYVSYIHVVYNIRLSILEEKAMLATYVPLLLYI